MRYVSILDPADQWLVYDTVVDPAELEAAASRLCSSAVGILMRRRPLP
jgi:hypothetical protein